jgi:hypothetical protein
MRFILWLLLLVFTSNSYSQYYFNDIISNQQSHNQYNLLIKNKIKEIAARSFENNILSDDFLVDQTISTDNSSITTKTISGSFVSYLISFYQKNLLIKSFDSSDNSIKTTTYDYNTNNQLIASRNISKDFDGLNEMYEDHIWNYNEKGYPNLLIKVKNKVDSTFIEFKLDSLQRVVEEIWKKNNKRIEVYYYYYNHLNLLTDIVRFNKKANALLPDFLFEYDERGIMRQQIQIQNANGSYLTWKYAYSPNGLKTKEYCYNKKKELLARIEYTYKQ